MDDDDGDALSFNRAPSQEPGTGRRVGGRHERRGAAGHTASEALSSSIKTMSKTSSKNMSQTISKSLA